MRDIFLGGYDSCFAPDTVFTGVDPDGYVIFSLLGPGQPCGNEIFALQYYDRAGVALKRYSRIAEDELLFHGDLPSDIVLFYSHYSIILDTVQPKIT